MSCMCTPTQPIFSISVHRSFLGDLFLLYNGPDREHLCHIDIFQVFSRKACFD